LVSISSTSEEVQSATNKKHGEFFSPVSISSTSEEVQSVVGAIVLPFPFMVSISSTSEEVQSIGVFGILPHKQFPLVQLPKKFKGCCKP